MRFLRTTGNFFKTAECVTYPTISTLDILVSMVNISQKPLPVRTEQKWTKFLFEHASSSEACRQGFSLGTAVSSAPTLLMAQPIKQTSNKCDLHSVKLNS